ncbi:uncharacterized protein LOC111632647 [Centruroides sculpturatus]|uniref:uncharacterized protein LOC111632647 n=1 Tax=Centruroides sculpturatus TaxID=218467 RepID=UPI000C6C9A0B|nr:uncharacterized protein LOC111632647 [Centruroides sculpturatus]
MSIHRIRLPVDCRSLLPKLKNLCLNKAIRCTRRLYYRLLHHLINLENELYKENQDLLKEVNIRVIALSYSLENRLKRKYIKKLKWLFKRHNIKPRVRKTMFLTAWDNISPPQCLLNALEYGPCFAPTPIVRPEDIIPNVELLVKNMSLTMQDYCRWKARFQAENEKRNNKNALRFQTCIKETRDWLRRNDVVLIKADKTKGMVLIKRDSYRRKLHEYIISTESLIAPNNFLEALQQRVRRFTLTPLACLLDMERAVVQTPRTPRIFAFGKTHKPGTQLRPVVEKCNAPTFKLEKQLVKFIRKNMQDSPFSVKNAVELLRKLEDVMLMDKEWMTVLDYKALYPSIKLPPCFCALRDFLLAKISNSMKYHMEILELADLVCHTSFFQFEDKTYLQTRGVPMGSPMSAILCELVLRNLENDILPSFQEDILAYARYVDDIFILWKDNHRVNQFLDRINDNPYGLTLELEQENGSIVNFLDLTISCKDGEIGTDIYRKPTYLPIVIPRNSADPEHIKMAVFRSWIRRAHTHCTSVCDTYKELEYIKNMAMQQGYRRERIDALIANCRKRLPSQGGNQRKERIVLNYIPFLKGMVKKVTRDKDVRIVYKRNPTVYRLLRNDKGNYERSAMAGVYSIPLKDRRFNTNLVYIGATLRNLKKRIAEHKQSVNKNIDSTVLAAFAKQQNIEVFWDRASIIKATKSRQAVKHLEKLEIHKAQMHTSCINHRDADGLSSAWKSFYDE